MQFPSTFERISAIVGGLCVYGYTLATFAVCALICLAGDRWWFATILLLGPRWIYAAPLAVLVPIAVIWRRSWLWPLAVAALVVAWPIMGFNLGWPRSSDGQTPTVRVMSFNIQRWEVKYEPFAALLDAVQPDVIAIQECPSSQWKIPDGWHVERAGELIVASRYPIVRTEVSKNVWYPNAKPITNGLYCLLDTPVGPLGVCCVHLDTPRRALQLILDPDKVLDLDQVSDANELLELRRHESRDLANWIRQLPGTKIVTGDFNMPVESAIYREYWSDYRNAFSMTGRGYGHTKHTRIWKFRYGARIDQILCGERLQPVKCWTEHDIGSDHLPLVADIAWE